MDEIIYPARQVSGVINVPGDKSISHRALLIGALAEGITEIENLATGQDVKSTAACLQELGIKIETRQRKSCVHGKGLFGFRPPAAILDVRNSGTTIRLLSGLLAGHPFATTITGDDSIQRRPMSRIIQPLRSMGARIRARNDEYAPLEIHGGNLQPIRYSLPVASAQVKSCLLFAGLFAEGVTEITEPSPTRDHSERLLQTFGARIEKNGPTISVQGPAKLTAQSFFVPGDHSSAAFFIAAAALAKESELYIENVGMNPTRSALITVLTEMGASIDILNFSTVNNECIADLIIRPSKLKGIRINGAWIPQLIDEIPILAVLATQAEGVTEIRDAEELRNKESDRLHAMAHNLKNMGARLDELEDGLSIFGPTKLTGAKIDPFYDHRIAMAFAIAGLIANGETIIQNAECVAISFPGFFETLHEVTRA